MKLRVASRSDTGSRPDNEDRVVHDVGRGLFAVIDGMGGEAAGEVAAAEAAERIATSGDRPLVTVFGEIRDALEARGRADPRLWGMGAVATAVRVREGAMEIAHVGDTRAWRWRPGAALQLLTRDHTIAQEAREMLGLAEGAEVPGGNRVTRDLGSSRGPPDHWVETREEPLLPGDRLVLSSDGLHGVLSSRELEEILEAPGDEEHAVERMIARVWERGAPDNVSVVVVGVHPEDG